MSLLPELDNLLPDTDASGEKSSRPPICRPGEARAWPLGNTIALAVFAGAFMGALFGFAAGFVASADRVQERVFSALPESARLVLLGADGRADAAALSRGPQVAKDDERATIETAQRAAPAVVSIVADRDVSIFPEQDEFFFHYFGGDPFVESGRGQTERRRSPAGTGFFVSADGYVVTNRHVVADEGAAYFAVLPDDSVRSATVLARDLVNDIAVLKVEPEVGEAFPVVELGTSENIRVGQTVIAIGFALGRFGNTVSRGIVSGLQRAVQTEEPSGGSGDLLDLIQTDAAINLGNSGGPLLDLDGRAIGMNTAIIGNAQSIGFAIPIDDVRIVADSVRETGRIQRPFLGVRYLMMSELNEEFRREEGLASARGALLLGGDREGEEAVTVGSPAAMAGLRDRDIITAVAGDVLGDDLPLAVAVRRHRVGDTVRLTVLRDGATLAIDVVLTERP